MMYRVQKTVVSAFIFSLSILPLLVSATDEENECGGSNGGGSATEKASILKYKIGAFFSILVAGVLGVCLPIFGLKSESNFFMFVKAFAAGVILATGFVHILPDATESLTSPCLGEESPWGDFPMTDLVAMAAAILTMLIESFASGYLNRSRSENEAKTLPVSTCGDKEEHSHIGSAHTHASQGHAHGSLLVPQDDMRKKIVTQILELGIVVHSVIIGISLGASPSVSTIKPLLVAITFHQLFEGFGLGGCISEAKFGVKKIWIMVLFFALTAPAGIGIGIGVSEIYNENSPMALKVSGFLNAAAAGILIYMALVDLVAPLFMDHKAQSSMKIQLACSLSLILGAGLMSLLAVWA
ncbi:probable zinc transporter 12 [Brassica rapa]|nr:probable zinc transporter 12 [Brassica rapa]XP_033141556.1 probable zinc transporter 12 [Brassica rapa]XP_033141557.1 probable zinc transporter 12 [Brassica rapa]XP_033141558.1 probable zinc transporter 12 [Brassica rapa]XP_033141559.1 probable zinc transporter 12 [Brassica rapa]XP_033141560.1 probable zinc transporter 12 [Brassica rapa]XP_033141561.1 probable zinc transporter 12 [Brassica rapa]XP_033141563.1 probable zinc transporter 12 [Brassica rapa]XP_033141564.1 probable zinc transp